MMNDTVLHYIDQSVLCWLATVDDDGGPNVSPKEIFCARGRDELLIANIASPGSLRNIRQRPLVCASFVDVFVQKGFKLKGVAHAIVAGEPAFDAAAEPLARMAGASFPFASVFVVAVKSVEPIVAPRYRLYPDTPESAQIESALQTYRVQRPAR